MGKMIVAIKWGRIGNENRLINLERVAEFIEKGYTVYETCYRPGLNVERRVFERQSKKLKA